MTSMARSTEGFPSRAYEEVGHRLLSLLAEIKMIPPSSITLAAEDDFLVALDLDSIDAVELTVQLDALFDVGFGTDPDDVDQLATFGTLVELIVARGTYELAGTGDVADPPH